MEAEDQKRENEMALELIVNLEDGRKCWRLVNGVLFEKKKKKVEVVLELQGMAANLS